MRTIDLGRVAFISSDETYRPSLWIGYRSGRWLVLFFGWQKPSVLWL